MFWVARRPERPLLAGPVEPPFWPALGTGALVGFISGMTGTGGGVFLAPLILVLNWVDIRRTTAITAAYNLLISAVALLGSQTTLDRLPSGFPVWLIAVACGGGIGATLGRDICLASRCGTCWQPSCFSPASDCSSNKVNPL